MASGKQSPQKVEARERRKYALYQRRRGLSFEEIGHELGVGANRARTIVRSAYNELLLDTNQSATEVRDQEIDRLDRALNCVWHKIEKGDLAAIDRLISISKRRSDLLGLDSPSRVDHQSSDGSMSAPVTIQVVGPEDDDKNSESNGDRGDG